MSMVKERFAFFLTTFMVIISISSAKIMAQSMPASTGITIRPENSQLTPGFSGEIEAALGIKDTGADIVPALTAALSKGTAAPAVAAESLNTLTASLLKGPSSTVLVERIAPLWEVGAKTSVYSNAAWKCGSNAERNAISDSLWKLAQAAQSKNIDKSHEFSRASLMLAAMSDMNQGWYNLAVVINEPEESQKLLGLTDGEFAKLKKVINDRAEEDALASRETIEGYKGIDAITQSKADKINDGDVKAILSHFDIAFRKGPAQLGSRWNIICKTWSLLNLVRVRNSENGQLAVRTQLGSWRTDFHDPNIDRWVNQALTREGPVPRLLYGELTITPDGKLAPVAPGKSEGPK